MLDVGWVMLGRFPLVFTRAQLDDGSVTGLGPKE